MAGDIFYTSEEDYIIKKNVVYNNTKCNRCLCVHYLRLFSILPLPGSRVTFPDKLKCELLASAFPKFYSAQNSIMCNTERIKDCNICGVYIQYHHFV